MEKDAGRRYLSYLLRLWRADGGRDAVWRASLEDARSGERLGFGSLLDLYVYLEGTVRGSEVGSGGPEGGRET